MGGEAHAGMAIGAENILAKVRAAFILTMVIILKLLSPSGRGTFDFGIGKRTQFFTSDHWLLSW